MGLRFGAVDLGLGRAYELMTVGLTLLRIEGLGLSLGAVDLGLERTYELIVVGLIWPRV